MAHAIPQTMLASARSIVTLGDRLFDGVVHCIADACVSDLGMTGRWSPPGQVAEPLGEHQHVIIDSRGGRYRHDVERWAVSPQRTAGPLPGFVRAWAGRTGWPA
ncbi:hypothetical protein AB0M46_10600 [Dactylosporangium sp. NPDC051485]|uniref:hypothetical protein n=1 Tax=Dactylosporangium sp. NPDC051485 TaxID=3154846 RepID=UPI0034178598